ncbi:hypothetical protein DMENIID0001_072880 [Sergentomyia squamirostris]
MLLLILQWSLRSNSTPDTRDVWTDTEEKHDDLLMMSERSDSGVTSPHSHHQLDDRTSLPSPCDLSMIDSIPNDDVRKRIIAMTKRPCYDDDDKQCLLQILSLLNNLEALSQDQEITGEFLSLEVNQSRRSGSTENYSVLEDNPVRLKNSARIVATVQPYSSGLDSSEEPIKPRYTSVPNTPEIKRSKNLATSALQESGVFDGDSAESVCQSTQTCPEDFPFVETATSGDLTAEIQKLNKFRQKIEECVTAKKASVVSLLSPEQRRLQYYKDRLELLENKILVYESSGDLQVRRLAERLQREIHLESLVKQLSSQLEEVEKENRTLDEERCEFEEAENDTRLRLQRLEVEFEILSQRNIELEMSRDALQQKLKDTKRQVVLMEDEILNYQSKIDEVESNKNELNETIEKIKASMPMLLLYHEFQLRQYELSSAPLTPKILSSDASSIASENSTERELRTKVSELTNRVKELEKSIDELKLAYNETLENADNLWAQMEKDYKDRLQENVANEQNMKMKIGQLEERIIKDSQYAQERLVQLEEGEYNLKHQISKLNRENKDLLKKYTAIVEEYNSLKDDCQKLKNYLEGPAAAILEKERSKVKILEDDLKNSQQILNTLEAMHKTDSSTLRSQMMKANKELEHIKVTNHELHEEVATLEVRLKEMRKVKSVDDDTIKSLSQELRAKQIQLNNLQQMIKQGNPPTLAQELGNNTKRICLGDPKPLKKATFELQNSIKNFEGCKNCMGTNAQVVDVCKGVKRLADSMLEDAERGKSPPKTEEVSAWFQNLQSPPTPSFLLHGLVNDTKNSTQSERGFHEIKMKNSRLEGKRISLPSSVEILGGILNKEDSLILQNWDEDSVHSIVSVSGKSSSTTSQASVISNVLSNLRDLKKKLLTKSDRDISYFSALVSLPNTPPPSIATQGLGGEMKLSYWSCQWEIPNVGSTNSRDVEQQTSRSSSQKILQAFHDNEESVSKEPENINHVINNEVEKDHSNTFVSPEISLENSTNVFEENKSIELLCETENLMENVQIFPVVQEASAEDHFKTTEDSESDLAKPEVEEKESMEKGIIEDYLPESNDNTDDHDAELYSENCEPEEKLSITSSNKSLKCESILENIPIELPLHEEIVDGNNVMQVTPKLFEDNQNEVHEVKSNLEPVEKTDTDFSIDGKSINSEHRLEDKPEKMDKINLTSYIKSSNEINEIQITPKLAEGLFVKKPSLIDTDRTFYSNFSYSDPMYTAREEIVTPKIDQILSRGKKYSSFSSETSTEWYFGEKAKIKYDKSNENEVRKDVEKMVDEMTASVAECLSKCSAGIESDKLKEKVMVTLLKIKPNLDQGISDEEQLSTLSEILHIKRDLFELKEQFPETLIMIEIAKALSSFIQDDKCKNFCGMRIRELTEIVRIQIDGWKKTLNQENIFAEIAKKETVSIDETKQLNDLMPEIVEKITARTAESRITINTEELNTLWESVTEIGNCSQRKENCKKELLIALKDNLQYLTKFVDQLESKEQMKAGLKTLSTLTNLQNSYWSGRQKEKSYHCPQKSTKRSKRNFSDRSSKKTSFSGRSSQERSADEMLVSARSYIHNFYESLDQFAQKNFMDTYRNINSALEALQMVTDGEDSSF